MQPTTLANTQVTGAHSLKEQPLCLCQCHFTRGLGSNQIGECPLHIHRDHPFAVAAAQVGIVEGTHRSGGDPCRLGDDLGGRLPADEILLGVAES